MRQGEAAPAVAALLTGLLWVTLGVTLGLMLAWALVVGSAGTAAAAPAAAVSDDAPLPSLPEGLTPEAVRDLVSRLSDAEARALLVRTLDGLAERPAVAQAPPPGLVGGLADATTRLRTTLSEVRASLPEVAEAPAKVADSLRDPTGASRLIPTLVLLAGMLAVGGLGEALFRRLFSGMGAQPRSGPEPSALEKLEILGLRLVIDLLALAAFGGVAAVVLFMFHPDHSTAHQLIVLAFWAVMFPRLGAAGARFAVAPEDRSLRLPDIDDAAARMIVRRVMVVTALVTIGVLTGDFFRGVGVSPAFLFIQASVTSFLVVALLVAMVWRDRAVVARLISSSDGPAPAQPSRVNQVIAANWHILVTCFLIGIWLAAFVSTALTGERMATPMIVSLGLLAAVPVADWILRAVITHMFGLDVPGATDNRAIDGALSPIPAPAAETGDRLRTRTAYRDVVVRNIRVVLAVIAAILLARVWEVDLHAAAAGGIGETLASALFTIVVSLILASAAWGIIRVAIANAAGAPEDAAEASGDMGGTGGSRLQTMVPLLGRFMLGAIAVIVTMVILSALGVNIGPLIAGAGVVGIAIGFGAQTLVKDILSGVFFLADDAFRVGEYVQIGTVRGAVEHISVRSLRLRHHNGPLNTVPFGEIRHLTNFSRDWAIMKLELRLPFDTDLEKVRKLIKKVGQELSQHPDIGPQFLQPLKSQGVNRMDDSAFIIRVKFMARPGQQFTLRREVFRRIQEAFARNGIQFAPRRVIVDAPAALSGVAAAAAADAMSRDEAPSQQALDTP
ncbi:MAG: mechanosensitive ion channel family protein [Rhodospirillales bacterium]|nr:MAG: mechanosensitive ion channel family protein [Rhodospirillales bacterium]